jgi:hypothetical protein
LEMRRRKSRGRGWDAVVFDEDVVRWSSGVLRLLLARQVTSSVSWRDKSRSSLPLRPLLLSTPLLLLATHAGGRSTLSMLLKAGHLLSSSRPAPITAVLASIDSTGRCGSGRIKGGRRGDREPSVLLGMVEKHSKAPLVNPDEAQYILRGYNSFSPLPRPSFALFLRPLHFEEAPKTA